MTTMKQVPKILSQYIPAPVVMPMPTVAHSPAAVVSPVMPRLRVKMVPAPRKLMAVTSPAAIRLGSSFIVS